MKTAEAAATIAHVRVQLIALHAGAQDIQDEIGGSNYSQDVERSVDAMAEQLRRLCVIVKRTCTVTEEALEVLGRRE